MRFLASPCLALALFWLGPTAAAATSAEDALPPWAANLSQEPEMAHRVVQRRKYVLDHELDILIGAFASDPFFKGVTGTLGYTLHINEFLGWEVLTATFSYNMDTDFKQAVLATALTAGKPTPTIPEVTGFAGTHFVLKPFYGKQAVRDLALVHLEIFLLLGPAIVLVDNVGDTGFAGGGDWAFGFRVWVNELMSVRAQLGQLIYYFDGSMRDEFHFAAGLSFNLGGDE
jgi:outer membrane beta-barrel protein